jgi:hypothetical protein
MPPRTYHRDVKGRFTKATPTPPLDPALVRSLGADRRPEILWLQDHDLLVTISRPKVAADVERG